MKKLLVILCVLTVLVGCLVFSAGATDRTAYCEHCKEEVTWEPMVFSEAKVPEGETQLHKHYYLTADKAIGATSDQISLRSNVTLCVDLNGYTWRSHGRAFNVSVTSDSTEGSTLNLMDSVGTGQVIGRSSTDIYGDGSGSKTNNTGGGTIYVEKNCTVNIYGGTYKLNVTTPDNLRTENGGIISVTNGATVNIYGGTIEGAKVSKNGGAIQVYSGGKLNIAGGRVTMGESVANTGGCINASGTTSQVSLSGNAYVDEIHFAGTNKKLKVNESFTGEVNITYAAGMIEAAAGLKIGTGTAGSLENGWLMCDVDGGYRVVNDGGDLKLAAIPEGVLYRSCSVCGGNVKHAWQPLAPKTGKTMPAGMHHRYLDRTMTAEETVQFQPGSGVDGKIQLCLDLYGNGFETSGRALSPSGGTVLNILDTKTGGYIQGSTGSNNTAGGTLYAGGAEVNLYSGTLKYKQVEDAGYRGTGKGGVVAIYNGSFSIYGGTVEGTNMKPSAYWDATAADNGSGGAIYMYGGTTLNVYGGHIKSGSAAEGKPGPCVYVHQVSCAVNLGGGTVDNIYFRYNPLEKFTVTGTYTGTASITFPDTLVLSENMVIGSAETADVRGTITCTNGKGYYVPVQDGKLILSSFPNGTVAGNGDVAYASVQEAVDAYENGVIRLCKSVNEDITITRDVIVELAGYNIGGNITVAEGATLYCMDEQTDDFDVSDGKYGKLRTVTGAVAGAEAEMGYGDSYLAICEDGQWSFHRVQLEIYAMTLSVDNTDDKQEPGLYYKSYFKADQMAADKIATFGVALSVFEAPDAANLDGENVKYSVHDHFEAGPNGNLGNNASTLLKGILKGVNTNATNKRNLSIPVIGRAYAKTVDGQVLFGVGVRRSLAEQLKGVDGIVESLSETQVSAVVKLYNKFESVLSSCSLEGIKSAVETEEEGTLKVLVLGNSHGLDATNLLYEVFHAENEAGNIDQKVVIGALYYSGCMINQHEDFLYGNQPVYSYHKNDGSNPSRTWTVLKDTTCLHALQDEQWDIILMQQMNHRAGMDNRYVSAEWKAVADYLLNNQDTRPKLGFHMTWTNPDNYELYLNDDAPYAISTASSWRKTHEQYFPGKDGKYDQSVLYKEITRCVQQYLVDSTAFLGEAYFDGPILASATAVQYAQDVLGRSQPEIYRDYTHMNDYGRLICAYLWYAQIMELEEITEVNMDAIPSVLHQKDSLFPAAEDNYAITEDMKADLIASVNWTLVNPFHLPE